MTENIFFWWSVTTTILSLVFLGWDIWQLATNRKSTEIQLKEKELHKAQVKIWEHFASGINHGLITLTESFRQRKINQIEGMEDILRTIQGSSNALYTSLNEERLFTDEEIKQRQLEREENFKKMYAPRPVTEKVE
ncbi:hypothetical protein KBG31_03365 [Patescibacteria group bacterium]|nr:hypothetical protein [Patescibacteria group bacterium]